MHLSSVLAALVNPSVSENSDFHKIITYSPQHDHTNWQGVVCIV